MTMTTTISPNQIRAEGAACAALVDLGVTRGLQPLKWVLVPGEGITGRVIAHQPGTQAANAYHGWAAALDADVEVRDVDGDIVAADADTMWEVEAGIRVPVRLAGYWRTGTRGGGEARPLDAGAFASPGQLRASAAAAADMARMAADRHLTPLWWVLPPYTGQLRGLLPDDRPASQMETVAREWGRALGVSVQSPYRDSWLIERQWHTTGQWTTVVRISGHAVEFD